MPLENRAFRYGCYREVMGLYRAMTKNETLKARLAISSEMIDCNQLINSFSLSEDSVSVAVTDTVSPTEMKLFVLPVIWILNYRQI